MEAIYFFRFKRRQTLVKAKKYVVELQIIIDKATVVDMLQDVQELQSKMQNALSGNPKMALHQILI